MTDTPAKCPMCGGFMLSGQMACNSCWSRFRDEAIAHRERRQEQERVRAEAREQGRIGEQQ